MTKIQSPLMRNTAWASKNYHIQNATPTKLTNGLNTRKNLNPSNRAEISKARPDLKFSSCNLEAVFEIFLRELMRDFGLGLRQPKLDSR